MQGNLALSTGSLYAFLLVLARIAGALVFVPLPGTRNGADIARLFAAVAITVALLPLWPHFDEFPTAVGDLVIAVLIEAAFGLSIGLAVSVFNEMLMMAAQIISLQAGFSYASTIDPSTSADSSLLLVIAQLIGGLLFLALGLHREVIRIFAQSLTAMPPGAFHADRHLAEALMRFGTDIFTIGLRLALPAVALLGLVDLSLALIGRINSQLQLLSLSFPIKILAALALLGLLAAMYPRVMGEPADQMLSITRNAAGLASNGR